MKILGLPVFVCAALSSLVALAACSGGGSSRGVLPIPQVISPTAQTSATTREALGTIVAPAAPESVAASNDLLYVSNLGNNSITVYHHDANGNTAPVYSIAGAKTGLIGPAQLSEDSHGNLYVANGFVGLTNESRNASVLVFAHGAHGNVAPIRKLAGPATRILGVSALTVDKGTDKLFVTSMLPFGNSTDPGAVLLRFAPNAGGNTAPFAAGFIGEQAVELALDSSGNNVIVQQNHSYLVPDSGVAETFPKQFANDATLVASHAANIFDASGLADDPQTKSYLVSGASFQTCNGSQIGRTYSGIVRLAQSTDGYANPNGTLPCNATLSPKPISEIPGGADCGQLVLGYLRNIYAVCGSEVRVYPHDASGNVAPLRVLSGSATQLNNPYGIYEGT